MSLFKRWLKEVKDQLPVPLRIEYRSKSSIRLSFANSRKFLEVNVYIGEINVAAICQGKCIDLLVSLDSNVPIQDKFGNIVCKFCDPNERPSYASLEEFWVLENFGRFLQWMKERYGPARWLGMYGTDGMSWAQLTIDKPIGEDNCLASIAL